MSTKDRDRTQPDRLQPTPQPIGARPVLEPPEMAAEKQRTGGTVLDRDADRGTETAGHRGRVQRLQPAEAGGGEIAGDAAHAEAIGAVWRHLDVDDRIAEPHEVGVLRPDRRVRRHLDNAVVVVAEAQLIGRAQHAARGDAADDAFLQHRAGARDDRPRGGKDAFHPGPRVGRAAHHLDLTFAGVDKTDLEAFGVRMALGRDDRGNDEGFECRSPVLHQLDVVAEHDQALDDLGERRIAVEVGSQPIERRFHTAPAPVSGPRTSEGMSSGRKP